MAEKKSKIVTARGSSIEGATKNLARKVERLLEQDVNYYYGLVNASEAKFQKVRKGYVAYQTIIYKQHEQIHGPDTY